MRWTSVAGRDSQIGDGVLGVVRGDTVIVEYQSELGVLSSAIEVIRDPDAVLDCVVDQPRCMATRFSGTCVGGETVFEIQDPSGVCHYVDIATTAGMSAEVASRAFMEAMRLHGLRFTTTANGALRLTNPSATLRCRPMLIDSGLDLHRSE